MTRPEIEPRFPGPLANTLPLNHKTVCKSLVSEKEKWYCINLCEQFIIIVVVINFYSLWMFIASFNWRFFTVIQCESKFPQVFSILKSFKYSSWSILTADPFINCLLPGQCLYLISNSLSHFSRLLGTVSNAPTTINSTITFMLHNFFSLLAKIGLSCRFLSFSFSKRQNPMDNNYFSSSLLKLGLFFNSGLGDPLVSQIPRKIACISFSSTDSGLHSYHLLVRPNLNLLHDCLWINFPAQSCCISFAPVCRIHLLYDYIINHFISVTH